MCAYHVLDLYRYFHAEFAVFIRLFARYAEHTKTSCSYIHIALSLPHPPTSPPRLPFPPPCAPCVVAFILPLLAYVVLLHFLDTYANSISPYTQLDSLRMTPRGWLSFGSHRSRGTWTPWKPRKDAKEHICTFHFQKPPRLGCFR